MASIWVPLLCLAILHNAGLGIAVTRHSDFYTAAVFEHARFSSESATPELIVSTNLDYYRRAAEIAKSKGADFIVFPEYGIIPPGSRSKLKPFLETVPDPKTHYTNPCQQSGQYSSRSILYILSCLARTNSMVVVANMGDIQNCSGQCPSDGVFQFNTNVVFDRDGTLLVRYHKEHLFFERGMDLPLEQQDTRFHTDFGNFATYICFDIMFGRMVEVAQLPDVEAIMFPTMWVDAPPQLTSVQYWQAWSLGNGVPLFAANLQKPDESAIGSGVFHGQEGALAYTFNPDGISKLVVAKVPRRNGRSVSPDPSITAINETSSWDWQDDGKDVPEKCSSTFQNLKIDYRCQKETMENYTLVKLTESVGHAEACNNGMCCSIDYSTNGLNGETFYLGVLNGTYSAFRRYFFSEESCVLTRCDAQGKSPCAVFPMKSKTLFHRVDLRANFTADFVYPSVIDNAMRLAPHDEWTLKQTSQSVRSIFFNSVAGRNLIAVGFKGRCYERDPPYIR